MPMKISMKATELDRPSKSSVFDRLGGDGSR